MFHSPPLCQVPIGRDREGLGGDSERMIELRSFMATIVYVHFLIAKF